MYMQVADVAAIEAEHAASKVRSAGIDIRLERTWTGQLDDMQAEIDQLRAENRQLRAERERER